MRIERIVVVTKPTLLEELLLRHHSRGQVKFFLERRGSSIDEADAAHVAYRKSLEVVASGMSREVPHEVIGRDRVSTYLFRETDLVVAVGPDGLVVNVGKYLVGQPVIGVNPDRVRVDGILMRFDPAEVGSIVRKIIVGTVPIDTITLAKAITNDGQTLYAMNDFLIGRRDQISARYTLAYGDRSERQSSSGILVSTGVGSSGWMRSFMTGVSEIGGVEIVNHVPFGWSEARLLFVVREPFPSKYTGTKILTGWVGEGADLIVSSEMSEGGTIFSDGVPEDAIEFNAGTIATITVAERKVNLVRPMSPK